MFREVTKEIYMIFSICAGMVVLLSGCASLQQQVIPGEKGGRKIVDIKAESFKFEPDNIKVSQGDTVVFVVHNESGSGHNFTIKGPQQEILKDVDLPPQKTMDIEVMFKEPGIYLFYCNKPLHATFGMKGQVEVVEEH